MAMSQYRGGSAITRGMMSNPSTPLLPHGGRRMSLGALTLESRAVYPQGQGSGIAYTDVGQHYLPNQTLEIKLDQMMGMITNTQQIIVEQQSNQVIMGERMEQISSDVQSLQKEMKELQQNTSADTNKRIVEIPKHLSVSSFVGKHVFYY